MDLDPEEEKLLRSVALQNANAVLLARDRAEEALRLSEQRFRAVFNHAAVGMAIAGLNGGFEQVNDRLAEILGAKKEELLGKTFMDLTHPDDAQKTREHMAKLVAGEIEDYALEKRYIGKNGRIIWCLTSVTMLKDSDGKPERFIGVIEDISERKEDEENRGHMAAVVESSDDAIISMSVDTVIATWNRGAERMFGFTAEEVIGKTIQILIPPHCEDEEPRIVQRLLAGERIDHYETVRQRKDGRLIDVSLTVSPIHDSSGKIVGVSKILRDITDRKRAEEALREAQEELRRHAEHLEEQVAERTARLRETIQELESFSYSVSHDMRSPLRAMQGYAEALLEEYEGKLDPTGQDYLKRIGRAASRMDLLIQDVLAYSRVAKGEIQLRKVNVEGVIRDVIQNYPALQPDRATIKTVSPIPEVMGHEAYLTQIVSNLLTNAVKFVEPGKRPEVEIRGNAEGDLVRITFTDNGIGIAPEHHNQIFQIFGRVYSDKKFEGTGIGLAIAKKAAERMGGSVGVDSQLGRGSHFFVLLKRAT
jgi:PAS domain S-box-containing protein